MTTTLGTTGTTARRRPRRLAAVVLAAALLPVAGYQVGQAGADAGPLHIERIEFSSVSDFSDDRRLVGFAENVFFGEVVSEGRTDESAEPVPLTDFTVRVDRSIKGSLSGEVTVTQQGGHVRSRNELRLMEGDTLLEPGQTYLFSTRSDPRGRQFLVPEFGDLKVRSAAHRDELQRRFGKARAEEVRYDPKG